MARERGAASAAPVPRGDHTTPALADQWEVDALTAIASCTDPDDALGILTRANAVEQVVRISKLGAEYERRWSAVRLRAEAKYGKLLGDPEPGRPKGNPPAGGVSLKADERTRAKARQVRAAQKRSPDGFEKYVTEDPSPSRAGLLRRVAAAEAPPKPKAKPKVKRKTIVQGRAAVSHDPAVVEWVRERYREGWTRERIVEASERKTDGWPRDDAELTNGGVSEVRAAIVALERMEGSLARAVTREKGSKRHLRRFWSVQKSGDLPLLTDTARNIAQMTQRLERLDLTTYDLGTETTAWQFEALAQSLVDFQLWADVTTTFVDAHVSERRKREMIRHMRENTAGRTPEEIATARKLAERLERRLNGVPALGA